MASSFPTSIDSFTDPLSTSPLNSPSHSLQHSNLNSAVNKIETYMGLVLVTSATVGTGVTSVTVSNCFSATYDSYKIIMSDTAGTSGAWLYFNVNGIPAQWYGNYLYANFASGAPLSVGANGATYANYVGGCAQSTFSLNMEINNPFLAKATFVNAPFVDANTAGTATYVLATNASYTGFQVYCNAVTMTGGTIRVYGYRK